MDWWELTVLAVGLSADAAAAALCLGLQQGRGRLYGAVPLWFGGAQLLLPLLGCLVAAPFRERAAAFAPVLAFVMLTSVGLHALREAGRHAPATVPVLTRKLLLLTAVATGLDAFAAGLTLPVLPPAAPARAPLWLRLLLACGYIGCVTGVLAALAQRLGGCIGRRGQSRAERAGGALLLWLAVRFLCRA